MHASKSLIFRIPLAVHLTVFAVVSALLAALLPFSSGLNAISQTAIQSVGVLYAVTIGFLMSISIERRRSLHSMILLELNKIRRIDHLAQNIVIQDPELKPWYTDLHASLEAYLEFFRTHDIGEYEAGNPLFRKVTYLIYALPQRKAAFESSLFGELLATTGNATEAREYIGNLIAPSVGSFQLGVVLIISFALSAMTAVASPFVWDARLGVTLANFCTFLAVGMFYDYEFIGVKMKRTMAALYIDNQQHLYGSKTL